MPAGKDNQRVDGKVPVLKNYAEEHHRRLSPKNSAGRLGCRMSTPKKFFGYYR